MRNELWRMALGRSWPRTALGGRRQRGQVSIFWLLLLGAVGGVLLYWYTTPQDAPSWARSHLPGLPEYTGRLYRWHDDQGREQVTDKPPKGRPFEPVVYPSNVNVVPAANRRESP